MPLPLLRPSSRLASARSVPPVLVVTAVLATLLLAAAGQATGDPQGASAPNESAALRQAWERGRTGIVNARHALEDRGVAIDLFYNHFVGDNAAGGIEPATGQSGSVDYFLRVDPNPLFHWSGGQLLVHGKSHYGRNVNPDVGALSEPFDDADGDEAFYFAQLWYQQAFFERRFELRLGVLDQQVVIDRNLYANSEDRQFNATYLDNNNATIPLLIGLGAAAFVRPWPWLLFTASFADADGSPFRAGFDTTFDDIRGILRFFELTLSPPTSVIGLPGNYRFGMVWDARERTPFGGGPTEKDDIGFYLSFDQLLWREREGADEGIGGFARFGYRDPDLNRIEVFWSVGVLGQGLLPGRATDLIGLGTYSALGSARYRDTVAPGFERETGVELFYDLDVTGWLRIAPDLQYIFQPGAKTSSDDAIVLGLRARVSFQ